MVYGKEPLQVMYGKYNIKDGIGWQMQHKAKPSAVFNIRPQPKYCIFLHITSKWCLTGLLFCIVRISSSSEPKM